MGRTSSFTVDPIASSLAQSAKDAEAVGLLEPVNLKGIYDLKPLNKILKAQGKPTVSASLTVKTSTGGTSSGKTTKATG